MSVNIEDTLKPYLASGGKSINIGSAIGTALGSAVGTVISEIFSGSVSIDGAEFQFFRRREPSNDHRRGERRAPCVGN